MDLHIITTNFSRSIITWRKIHQTYHRSWTSTVEPVRVQAPPKTTHGPARRQVLCNLSCQSNHIYINHNLSAHNTHNISNHIIQPLVNVYIPMERSTHFQWVTQQLCQFTRGYHIKSCHTHQINDRQPGTDLLELPIPYFFGLCFRAKFQGRSPENTT